MKTKQHSYKCLLTVCVEIVFLGYYYREHSINFIKYTVSTQQLYFFEFTFRELI